MAATRQWSIHMEGNTHSVQFQQDIWWGKHKLMVNGQQVQLKKPSGLQALVGLDMPIDLGGKECRFVLLGNRPDIAVDGVYIDSKQPYTGLKGMPWWAWIFVILCALIPVVALGGAIPAALGAVGALLCLRVSARPNMHAAFRALACFGITIGVWILFILLAIGTALAM